MLLSVSYADNVTVFCFLFLFIFYGLTNNQYRNCFKMCFGLNIEGDKLKNGVLIFCSTLMLNFSIISAFKSSQIGHGNVHKKSNMLCKIMSQ